MLRVGHNKHEKRDREQPSDDSGEDDPSPNRGLAIGGWLEAHAA